MARFLNHNFFSSDLKIECGKYNFTETGHDECATIAHIVQRLVAEGMSIILFILLNFYVHFYVHFYILMYMFTFLCLVCVFCHNNAMHRIT